MILKRSVLWIMLFSGVIVHMICYSTLNIAITKMVKQRVDEFNKTVKAYCRSNLTNSMDEEIAMMPVNIDDGEYDWDNKEISVLMGSFSWVMGLAQLTGALLSKKYGGKIVFGFSNLGLGILSLLIPIVSDYGITPVIVIRALQGIIGVNICTSMFLCSTMMHSLQDSQVQNYISSIMGGGLGVSGNALISKWVPPDERAKFMSTMGGMYFGTAFSYFFNGWILHFFGWRCIFYISTAISLCWCAIWYFIVYETPQEDPNISSSELIYIEKSLGNSLSSKKLPVPWLSICTSMPVIVNTLLFVGSVFTVFTYMIYIPTYLQDIHGFPSYQVGEFSSLPYLLEGIFTVVFAAFTDTLLRKRTFSVTNVRKMSVFVSSVVSGILFGCLVFGGCNTTVVLALLTLGVMFSGAIVAGGSANIVDLSPNFCAVILGMQSLIVSSTGYISPIVVGYFTDSRHITVEQWNKVFLVTFGVNIFPALLFFIFGDSRIQPWNFEVNPQPEKLEPSFIGGQDNNVAQMTLDLSNSSYTHDR